MSDSETIKGNVVIHFKIRDPESRMQMRHLLLNLPGVEINSTIFELETADWDEGLWEETIERMEAFIDTATDTLVFWHAADGQIIRTSIAGRFA